MGRSLAPFAGANVTPDRAASAAASAGTSLEAAGGLNLLVDLFYAVLDPRVELA